MYAKMSKLKFEMFSESRMELEAEMKRHPALIDLMYLEKAVEWEDKLACCATFLNILVDESFTPEQMDKLQHMFIRELRQKRSVIIQ